MSTSRFPLKTVCLTLAATALAGTAGALGLIYSGYYDVSAIPPHNPLVAWALHSTYEHSLHRHAQGIVAPPDLMSEANLAAGARRYAATCVACHGAPGQPPGPIAQGILPAAPLLLAATRRNKPPLMFWTIRNGVRMTAMPAFGKSFDDHEIWQLAAFLNHARGISAGDYAKLVAAGGPPAPAPAVAP
ncbi:c-type cytochrome [Burkholderia gladioli]|uniref:c-type cytochrome n=1 Tax=Burkholderia gladioli TaxID=28095 RepID=UPI00163F5538|nr:cytochrome c [Burkholderia gladioli]